MVAHRQGKGERALPIRSAGGRAASVAVALHRPSSNGSSGHGSSLRRGGSTGGGGCQGDLGLATSVELVVPASQPHHGAITLHVQRGKEMGMIERGHTTSHVSHSCRQ